MDAFSYLSVLPADVPETGVSLRAYYERHRRWFFGWFLATLIISVSKDVVLGGRLPNAFNLAFHIYWRPAAFSGSSSGGIAITRSWASRSLA